MTTLEIAMVGFGGFLGAVLRYFVSRKLNNAKYIPFGTLMVNYSGSLVIGIVFGMDLPVIWTLFFAAGFAGAFTTFSTLKKEIIVLYQSYEKKVPILYTLATYFGGIGLALIGYWIGAFL